MSVLLSLLPEELQLRLELGLYCTSFVRFLLLLSKQTFMGGACSMYNSTPNGACVPGFDRRASADPNMAGVFVVDAASNALGGVCSGLSLQHVSAGAQLVGYYLVGLPAALR